MGRFISESVINNNLNDAFGAAIRPPGFLGVFGAPGTYSFTVPSNVSSIRVRVAGAGGGGVFSYSNTNSCSGGVGGGGGGSIGGTIPGRGGNGLVVVEW